MKLSNSTLRVGVADVAGDLLGICHSLVLVYRELSCRCRCCRGLADLAEEPVQKPVEPCPAETEPAAGTHLLATEGQDEVAVAHLPERQSGIHELEVGIAPPVGIGEGCPYGHDTRMEPRIGLAQSAREA